LASTGYFTSTVLAHPANNTAAPNNPNHFIFIFLLLAYNKILYQILHPRQIYYNKRAVHKILSVFGTVPEYGGITEVIQSKSKNSRSEAQNKGPYNPFVLCRMFAVPGAANYGCLYLRHLLWRDMNGRFYWGSGKQ